jgi:hypothetical protein
MTDGPVSCSSDESPRGCAGMFFHPNLVTAWGNIGFPLL